MKYLLVSRYQTHKIIGPVENNLIPEIYSNMRTRGYNIKEITKPPHRSTIARWKKNGVMKATDGCEVNGLCSCSHQCWSWEKISRIIKGKA